MSIRADDRLSEYPPSSVMCRECGAQVSVRKSSRNQTSVQWDTDSVARCLERRPVENVAAYSARGVFLACSGLGDSIVRATHNGDIRVVDEMI